MAIKQLIIFVVLALCFYAPVFAQNFSISSYKIKGSLFGTGSISFAGLAWNFGSVPGVKTEMRFINSTFLSPYIAHLSPVMFSLEFPVMGYETLKPKMGYEVVDPKLSLYLRMGYGKYSSKISESIGDMGWVIEPGISFKKRMDIIENVALGLSAGYRLFTDTNSGGGERGFYIESFITSSGPLKPQTPNSEQLIGVSLFSGYRFLPFIKNFNRTFGETNGVEIEENLVLLMAAMSMGNDDFSSSFILSTPMNADNATIYFADLLFGYFLYSSDQLHIKPSVGINFSWLESVRNFNEEYIFTSSIWPGLSVGSDFQYEVFAFDIINIAAEVGVMLKYSKIPENKAKNRYRQILSAPSIDLSGVELRGGLTFLF